MNEQPTPERILSSTSMIFSVTDFCAWVTQTPPFANSRIWAVHQYQSIEPVEYLSHRGVYIIMECRVLLPAIPCVSNTLWILMDAPPEFTPRFYSPHFVKHRRTLVSASLDRLLILGWKSIKTLHYNPEYIPQIYPTRILCLQDINDMYDFAIQRRDILRYVGWLCLTLFGCLERCSACFGLTVTYRNPHKDISRLLFESAAARAECYVNDRHTQCCKSSPLHFPELLRHTPSAPINGMSQLVVIPKSNNHTQPQHPVRLPTPPLHNPFSKKRLHDEALNDVDHTSPRHPLPPEAEPSQKRSRVELDEGTISSLHTSKHPSITVSDPERPITIINSTMRASEIVTALGYYGCRNLGPKLDLRSCSEHPLCNGGLGDVYMAKVDHLKVAIKTTRVYVMNKDEKYLKYAAKELYTWSKCKHPNVLNLLGLVEFRGQIGMVSEWMSNGDVRTYLDTRPETDRCQLCHGISDGLVYLHDVGIIHGDLKGGNILISEDGTPMLNDFGNAVLQEHSLQFTESTTRTNISPRWTAPEILEGLTSYSYAADVYALGMTWLEVITGKVPFQERRNDIALAHIIVNRKEIPQRPNEHIPSDSEDGDALWSLMMNCWAHKPEERPSANEARDFVKTIKQSGLSCATQGAHSFQS
ncbi:Ephrin type-A receptor 4 [Rhizoctonia solani]|uniref:Ephrin type-A receptor 4 n=1 Tax=Rhizoctonia solani TaxID=456999 RepID=A0A0K6FY89_9AGAM|nr:Ephrin type-A receptor 4 [Rhizoctonia solani]